MELIPGGICNHAMLELCFQSSLEFESIMTIGLSKNIRVCQVQHLYQSLIKSMLLTRSCKCSTKSTVNAYVVVFTRWLWSVGQFTTSYSVSPGTVFYVADSNNVGNGIVDIV